MTRRVGLREQTRRSVLHGTLQWELLPVCRRGRGMCMNVPLPLLSSSSLYFISVSPPSPFPFLLSGSEHPNLLYIAMAGTHQVWVHFLENAKWLKGRYDRMSTTENVWGVCRTNVSSCEYYRYHKASHTILLQQRIPSPEHVWQNMDGWTDELMDG